MKVLASFFVGQPLHILIIALIFGVGFLVTRFTDLGSERHPLALLVVVVAWAVYAAWEWLVITRTPEADIRVDLLLVWPLVFLVTLWFTIRAFR